MPYVRLPLAFVALTLLGPGCSESVPPAPFDGSSPITGDCDLSTFNPRRFVLLTDRAYGLDGRAFCFGDTPLDSLSLADFEYDNREVRLWRMSGGTVAHLRRQEDSFNYRLAFIDGVEREITPVAGIPGRFEQAALDEASGRIYALSHEVSDEGRDTTALTTLGGDLRPQDVHRFALDETRFEVLDSDASTSAGLYAAAFARRVTTRPGTTSLELTARLLVYDLATRTPRVLDVALPGQLVRDLLLDVPSRALLFNTYPDGLVRRYDLDTGALTTVLDLGPPDDFTAQRLLRGAHPGTYLANYHDGTDTYLYDIEGSGAVGGARRIPGVWRQFEPAGAGAICARRFNAEWRYTGGPYEPEVLAQFRLSDLSVISRDTVALPTRLFDLSVLHCG